MKLSKQGAMELIGHEAIVQTRYRDTKNIWTIGVGHTKAAGDPDPAAYTEVMPLKEVFKLFQKDMQNYADDVNAALKVPVSQTEFDALVSFHFNTGGINKASLVKSINAGDKKTAAKQFLNWKKPPEVMGRRKKEQKLFAEGTYSNGGKAKLVPPTRTASCSGRRPRSSISPRSSTRRDVPHLNSTPAAGGGARGTRRGSPMPSWSAVPAAHAACRSRLLRCPPPRPI